MKKLMLLAGVVYFVFASCCNAPKEEAAATPATCENQEKPECCKMSEEMKQACEDWKNWENLDQTRQEELLAKKKECYDKCKAERDEKAAKMAEIDTKMADWDNMTIADKKAVFDELDQLCPKKCCKGKKPEGCCHNKDKQE